MNNIRFNKENLQLTEPRESGETELENPVRLILIWNKGSDGVNNKIGTYET